MNEISLAAVGERLRKTLPYGEDDVRETVTLEIASPKTNRARLMTGTSSKAGVWASMPKPPQDEA